MDFLSSIKNKTKINIDNKFKELNTFIINEFINRINNVEDFDDSSQIMENVSTTDLATGETKPARVLVKYKCVVKISYSSVNIINVFSRYLSWFTWRKA